MALKLLENAFPPIRTTMAVPGGGMVPSWQRWFTSLPEWLFMTPSCHVTQTAATSTATATGEDMLWNTSEHDNAGFHSLTSNTDRITIPQTAIYQAGCMIRWADDGAGTGMRQSRISLNDAAPVAAAGTLQVDNPLAASFNGNSPTNIMTLPPRKYTAGDILRVQVYQDSGGNLDVAGVTASGPLANGFWCVQVSR